MAKRKQLPSPVLLVGERRAAHPAARALDATGVSHTTCRTLDAACSREHPIAPHAVLLCAAALTRDSAEQVAALCTRFPEAIVVVLAPQVARWELRDLLSAGASGVLIADSSLERCVPACIQAALAGQVCVPRAHRRELAQPALSAREKQVLGLVVMGYMNCQIAERLYLAESTVKSHLSSAFSKLGVRSRNEATSLILDPDGGFGLGILGLSMSPTPAA